MKIEADEIEEPEQTLSESEALALEMTLLRLLAVRHIGAYSAQFERAEDKDSAFFNGLEALGSRIESLQRHFAEDESEPEEKKDRLNTACKIFREEFLRMDEGEQITALRFVLRAKEY